MVVDRFLHVEVFAVVQAGGGIGVAALIECGTEFTNIASDVVALLGGEIDGFRVDVVDTALTPSVEAGVARIGSVDFEEIAASYVGCSVVGGIHPGNVDAVFTTLDFLDQRINPHIVGWIG